MPSDESLLQPPPADAGSSSEELDRLRTVFDLVGDAVFVIDGQGRVREANRAALERYGYPREELLGMKILDINAPAQHPHVPDRFEKVLRDGAAFFETVHRTKDGRHIPTEVNTRSVRRGDAVFVISVCRDITDRKRAEDLLLRAKQEWERTFDAVPDLICIVDDEFRIVRLNRPMAERLGWEPGACIGNFCYRIVHGLSHPPENCPHLKTVQDGKRHDGEVYEERLKGHFHVSTTPLRDGAGRHAGTVHVARDITQRKKAEEALAESERLYRTLFETATDAIFVADSETGMIVDANRRAQEMVGRPLDEIRRMHQADLHPPEISAAAREAYDRVIRSAEPCITEIEVLRKDGRRIPVEISSSGTVEFGDERLHFGIFRDVTDRKRMERRKASMERYEAVGRLAGGMAHKINNLMTVVSGYASIIKDSLPPEDPRREKAEIVRKAGEDASQMAGRLLAFARMQLLFSRRVEIGAVLAGMEGALRAVAGEVVSLVFEPSPAPLFIRVDTDQLQQALEHLVANAREAMPSGGAVTVRWRGADAAEIEVRGSVPLTPGAHAAIEVIDAGTGMDAATLEQVFDPFSSTRTFGRGLGLPSIYGFVRQSDGQISVDSAPGRGTRVSLYFPIAPEGTPDAVLGPDF